MVNINSIVKIMSSLDGGSEESLPETRPKSDRTAFSFDSLTPEQGSETAQETVPSETEVSAECSPRAEIGFEFGDTQEAPAFDAPPAAAPAAEATVTVAEQETVTANEELQPAEHIEQTVATINTTEPNEANHLDSTTNSPSMDSVREETIISKEEPQPAQHTEPPVVANDSTEQSETNLLDLTVSSLSMGNVQQETMAAKEEPQPVQHTEHAVAMNAATESNHLDMASSSPSVGNAHQEIITAKEELQLAEHTEHVLALNATTEPNEENHWDSTTSSPPSMDSVPEETITTKEEPQPAKHTEEAVVKNDTTELGETNHLDSATNSPSTDSVHEETIAANEETQPAEHAEQDVVVNDTIDPSETNHLESTSSSPSMGSVRDFAHRFSTSYRPISPSSSSSLSRKSTLMPIARSVSDGPPLPIGAVTASVRSTNPFLEELLYSIKLLSENDPALTVLDLKDASVFTVDHGSALAAALEHNSFLKELNLCNAKVATTTASELAQALQTNSTLEVLNLESNAIGPLGMKHLAEALAVNSALLEVRLSYQKAPAGIDAEQTFANALAKNETLTKLGLQFRDPASRNACDRATMRNKEAARKRKMSGLNQ
ncbi:hypothetical protein HDU81_007195 [Chytriomyces hyalinus]|nr:hypothetical protein HDU81_007195 [Chytriomyces hyalinus]